MKRRKAGTPDPRARKTQRAPVRKLHVRARSTATRSPFATGSTADEPDEHDSETMEGFDLHIPSAAQDQALAARRQIEQLREEKWLHDALDDFPDA